MEQKITLVCMNGEEIAADPRLLEYSSVLKQNSLDEKIPCEIISGQNMKRIIEFYEAYNYDRNAFKDEIFQKKITSDKLKETIGEKNITLLKDFIIEENKVKIEEMKDLVESCYHFDFIELKNVLLKAIGTDFYCGPTEQEMENYKKKFNIPNEIPPEEQLHLMTVEYKEAFEKLNEKLMDELHKAEPQLQQLQTE